MKTRATFLIAVLFASVASAQVPFSADDFLNSIGVNSSVSRRGESLEKTAGLCAYLGIRWIRTGYEGDIPVSDLLALHKKTGMKFSYGLLSGGTDFDRLIKGARDLAASGALLSVEGLNEPNNWAVNYKGQKGGRELPWLPVAHLHRDLYTAIKGDPVLKNYPVWALSENGAQVENTGLQFLEIPKGAGTVMPEGTRYADFANCHNYFIHPSHPYLYDNQVWNAADPGPLCKVDGLYGNYGNTWRNHFKGYSIEELINLPKVTTETGVTLGGEVTEEKQARLFLNLYLAQFARGWSYTALYLLRDRSDEEGNQSFGFYTPDYKPRKSALYLHNLTTILAEPSKVVKNRSATLDYVIPTLPETSHQLLLRKTDGKFALVLWAEKVKGTDEVKVVFKKPVATIKVYDPTEGTSPVKTLRNVKEQSFILSDHPLILEI